MRRSLKPSVLKTVYDRAASRYDLYHSLVTLKSDERGRRLVVHEGVRRGDKVLDAGGGTGTTSLLAARKVGPKGRVVVFDMSKGMLKKAKEKAARAGLAKRMSFKTGDILRLPFADGSFDAVLTTYSLCPLYDPARGALELYRVVKPGGRLAAAHSAEPSNAALRWIGHRLEDLVWRFPQITLGCRPVSVLPALKKAGAEVLFEKTFGIPIYPFDVFVVGKPRSRKRRGRRAPSSAPL